MFSFQSFTLIIRFYECNKQISKKLYRIIIMFAEIVHKILATTRTLLMHRRIQNSVKHLRFRV